MRHNNCTCHRFSTGASYKVVTGLCMFQCCRSSTLHKFSQKMTMYSEANTVSTNTNLRSLQYDNESIKVSIKGKLLDPRAVHGEDLAKLTPYRHFEPARLKLSLAGPRSTFVQSTASIFSTTRQDKVKGDYASIPGSTIPTVIHKPCVISCFFCSTYIFKFYLVIST